MNSYAISTEASLILITSLAVHPFWTQIFVSSCLLLAMLFSPAVGPLFPFFSLSTAHRDHFVEVHMLVHVLVLVSQLLRAAAVADVRHVSCHAKLLYELFFASSDYLCVRADPHVLLRTCFYVPPHAPSRAARGWSPAPLFLPPRPARGSRWFQSPAALVRDAYFAIHLQSAFAEGLSVDEIVLLRSL